MKRINLITAVFILTISTFSQLLPSSLPAVQKEKEQKLELERKEEKAKGISFRDYYRTHKAEVDKAVARGALSLGVLDDLRDLTDFDEKHVPGLAKLQRLNLALNQLTSLSATIFQDLPELRVLTLAYNQLKSLPANIFLNLPKLQILNLDGNQLTSLPADIFQGLTSLEVLYLDNNQLTSPPTDVFKALKTLQMLTLSNNPIPLTQAQLAKELELPANVALYFKSPEQEVVEHDLINAITNAQDEAVRQLFIKIMGGRVKGPNNFKKIDISKIRDAQGNNLLHLVVRTAAKRIAAVRTEIKNVMTDEALSDDEKKTATDVWKQQITDIENRYLTIFMILIQFRDRLVHEMLLTRNAQGDDVISSALITFGKDSAFVKAIKEVMEEFKQQQPAKRFAIKSRGENENKAEEEEITNQRTAQRKKLEKSLPAQ